MKPIIWLLVFLIITIAISLVFTQYISKLQPDNKEDDKEGFLHFFVMGAISIIDRALKDKCKNQTNDASNRYSNRNATSGQRNSACDGGYLVNKYSEELVKRWDQSKQTAVERAFKNHGVTFISNFKSETTQRDINFLLIFFKEVHGIDLLTYPYDGNMNKFKELVQNMKTANATSFQDYLAQSIAVNDQPLPPHLMGEVKPPHLMVKSEGFAGNITNIGCYMDNDKRAVPNIVANVPYNEDGINQCADKASAAGSSVFGLQYRNGNNAQCFIGDGSPNEIENAKKYGKSSQDCTKNAVALQNNLFVLPPKPKVFSDMDIFKEFASNKDLQKKFKYINPADYTQVLNRKADLSKAMQPPSLDGFTGFTDTGNQLKEGIDTVPMTGYTGYPNTERGMATTWNTFYKSSNVNNGPEANCKKICDKNADCKAFVVQKREPGPWDCWTIPASNLNAANNPAKPNAAQATYVKQPKNIKCAADAVCKNPEGFTSTPTSDFDKRPTNLGGMVFDPHTLGSVLMSSTSEVETLTNNYTLVANKDFAGNDMANMPIRGTTVEACKAKCDETTGCKGFVFDKRNNVNNCWLKSVPIPAERLTTLNGVDTYYQPAASSSSTSNANSWLAKSNANIAQISAASQNVPKNVGQNANFAEFNNNVSKLTGLKINTNAAVVLQMMKENGIDTSNTQKNQVKITVENAIGMGVKTEIQLFDLLQKIQMQNKANCIKVLNLMGVRYYETPATPPDQNELGNSMINIFGPFQISSYDQLNNYYMAASDANGRLREIGVRPDLTTLKAMVNFKYTYGGVMDPNFVGNMKAFGFNSNSDFAGILNSMSAFGINTKNLADFKTKTGMTNINDLPNYVTTMKSFGIQTNNSDHIKILGVAQQYKVDGDTIPSPAHTIKTLQLLKDAEISNLTVYKDFRKFMETKFANYDDAAFVESLTKFGTFKNRGSDNKGRLKRTEIERVVNTLHNIKPFKSSNNVSFRELIDSLTSQNLRLNVAGDQTKKFMKFDQDAAKFLSTFSGASQKNFGNNTQGFTDGIKEGFSSFLNMFSSSPEPFDNAYDINRNLGISNPVQAIKHAQSPGGYMSEPDFYSLVRSFGVKTVSDYDDFVKVFKLFGSNNENIMEVIGVLNVFGVPKTEYKKFVEKLTKIGVTYPYFKYFMETIMDFGVTYGNFDKFMNHLNIFKIQFTTPVKVNGRDDNTFYKFLSFMKKYGMAIQYKSGEYNRICKNKVQPNNAFFNAINNMILYGYTIYTFFPGEQGVVSASDMIQYIHKYDCQLLDFTTIDAKFYEKMRGRTNNNKKSVFEMIGGVEEKDKYLKYFSNIFIGKVANTVAFTPNSVYSFMTDAEFNRQTGHLNTPRIFYGGNYFRNLAVKYTDVSGSGIIENKLNNYLDGEKVRESEKEKYISLSLLMNTLRLFPNFIAGFMQDTMINKTNPYNAYYSSEEMEKNPFLQRGNTRYINAQTDVNKAVGQRPQT